MQAARAGVQHACYYSEYISHTNTHTLTDVFFFRNVVLEVE